MAYDIHGPWHGYTAFNSPLETDPLDPLNPTEKPAASVTGTVRFFLSEGVPAETLVLGVPFYGRRYERVPDTGHGLYQSFDNSALNGTSWDLSDAPTYRELVDVGRILEPGSGTQPPRGRDGYQRHWSDAARAPWLYKPPAADSTDGLGTFISYDDPTSMALRVDLIRTLGLRGAMIWEISMDSDAGELVGALSRLLGR
jgi:chitinase